MSRDGYLPDNVSEADYDRAFPSDCPDECASMQEPTECGECEEIIEECVCWLYELAMRRDFSVSPWRWRLAEFMRQFHWTLGFRGPSKTPAAAAECDCMSPAEIRADREEARAEVRRDSL